MGDEASTVSSDRPDMVVSVRFAVEEVEALKRLAEAQKIPLSTLIRRIALNALSWTPPIVRFGTGNEASAGSGWATYQPLDAQSGSWTESTSVAVDYSAGIS
jgi:hypothetical protein